MTPDEATEVEARTESLLAPFGVSCLRPDRGQPFERVVMKRSSASFGFEMTCHTPGEVDVAIRAAIGSEADLPPGVIRERMRDGRSRQRPYQRRRRKGDY
jgi:hypothetical protein